MTYPCQVKYYMKCYRILIRKPNCYTKFNYEVNQSKKDYLSLSSEIFYGVLRSFKILRKRSIPSWSEENDQEYEQEY